MRFCHVILFSFCLLLVPCAFALKVPSKPTNYVNDYTHTLTVNQEKQLDDTLRQFDQKTSTQIFVAILPSLHGDNLEDFSMRLAEKWKPGSKNKNNGAILLIIKNDHKMRIEVGYGLEGVITDALSGSIIRTEIAPQFRQGQFFEGIKLGVQSMMKASQGLYKAKAVKQATMNPFLCIILFVIFFGILIRRFVGIFGLGGYFITGGGPFGGGGFGGGGFGGGGFGGGGGGGFGGGGASGGW